MMMHNDSGERAGIFAYNKYAMKGITKADISAECSISVHMLKKYITIEG